MPPVSRKLGINVLVENVTDTRPKRTDVGNPFNLKMAIFVYTADNKFEVVLGCKCPTMAKDWSMSINYHVVVPRNPPLEGTRRTARVVGGNTVFPQSYAVLASIPIEDLGENIPASIRVPVYMEITDVKGFCLTPSYDFSTPEDLTDVVIVVENKEFNLNKTVLGNFSLYFKSMFFGNFNEARSDKIEIGEVSAKHFQTLMEILYHQSRTNIDNAREILPISVFFQIEVITAECERIVSDLSEEHLPLKEKLQLSDKYHLPMLMKSVMANIKSVQDVKRITPENINELSSKTRTMLLQKCMDLTPLDPIPDVVNPIYRPN